MAHESLPPFMVRTHLSVSSPPQPYSMCGRSSWLLGFQFSLLTAHCSRSSALGPTLLRDAPKSHSQGYGSQTVSASQIAFCRLLERQGLLVLADKGQGRASHNCPFLKPVRTLVFLTGALEQKPRGHIVATGAQVEAMPRGWAKAPLPCFPG